MKKKMITLLVLIALIPIMTSSCLFFKWVFRKTEDIPQDVKSEFTLSVEDILPEGIESLIPSNLKDELDEETLKTFMASLLTEDVLDFLVEMHYDDTSDAHYQEVVYRFENSGPLDQTFDEILLPVDHFDFDFEEVVKADFFRDVHNDIKKRGEEIWFNPELEVFGLDLNGEMKIDLVHDKVGGDARVSMDLEASKNGYGINTRPLLEDTFDLGKKKRFSFNPSSEWIFMALINNPGVMYVSGNALLDLELRLLKSR